MMPPTGPDAIKLSGRIATSSSHIQPPFDCITRNGRESPRDPSSALVVSMSRRAADPRWALNIAALVRSYSPSTGATVLPIAT